MPRREIITLGEQAAKEDFEPEVKMQIQAPGSRGAMRYGSSEEGT